MRWGYGWEIAGGEMKRRAARMLWVAHAAGVSHSAARRMDGRSASHRRRFAQSSNRERRAVCGLGAGDQSGRLVLRGVCGEPPQTARGPRALPGAQQFHFALAFLRGGIKSGGYVTQGEQSGHAGNDYWLDSQGDGRGGRGGADVPVLLEAIENRALAVLQIFQGVE